MLAALLACALSAAPDAPQAPDAPPKVAALRFNVVDLSVERADFYTEHLADRLADQGLEVITSRQVASMLGYERQKQLLGCTEDSSCLADIGNALGADALLLGDVAKLEGGYQLSLKAITAQTGQRVAAYSEKVATEAALLDALGRAAPALATQLAQHFHKTLHPRAMVATVRAGSTGSLRQVWWVPTLAGALVAGGGAVGLVVAENNRAALATGSYDRTQADQLLQSGQTARALGWVGVGVGAAALGVGVAFLIFGGNTSAAPVAMVTPDSAVIGIAGSLP